MLELGIIIAQVYKPTLLVGRKNAQRPLLPQSRLQYWRHSAFLRNSDKIKVVKLLFYVFRYLVSSRTQSISIPKVSD